MCDCVFGAVMFVYVSLLLLSPVILVWPLGYDFCVFASSINIKNTQFSCVFEKKEETVKVYFLSNGRNSVSQSRENEYYVKQG
jgi:hypothetical protein